MKALRWLASSKCGWRLPVYGLVLLVTGVIAGYAIGYKQGWENALKTVEEALGLG